MSFHVQHQSQNSVLEMIAVKKKESIMKEDEFNTKEEEFIVKEDKFIVKADNGVMDINYNDAAVRDL